MSAKSTLSNLAKGMKARVVGYAQGNPAYRARLLALGITRELGPVLGGLMVAGRVSAAIAAELGTMRVTEQIDALTTLSTNPLKYLVVPRVLAATLAVPVLVAEMALVW